MKNRMSKQGVLCIGIIFCLLLILGPFFMPVYWTIIITEILIMGLFAMSLNLLLGFTGLLSFGQAGFFGVGAYTTALIILKGGQSLWLALAASGAAAALTAVIIGYLCVRRDEIYFAMITLGFGMMLYTAAHNWIELTGGSDGLPLMTIPPLGLLVWDISLYVPVNMYLFVLIITALGSYLLWRVTHSPFGLILRAIRENKDRLNFVGADVQHVRLASFVLSGALAGVAGALFCLFNYMATPDFMHWSFSSRPILMTILGGSGIFFGPLFGAAVFLGLEQIVTEITENWMIILGGILIPVVLFFPKGILGTVIDRMASRRGERK